MTRLLTLLTFALVPLMATAEEPQAAELAALIRPAGDTELDAYKWNHRPVVVFADDPADPQFGEQMEMLNARLADLAERDVIVLTDTDPAANSPLRRKLRPRGFMLVLVGKDGEIKLRKPNPWSVRELSRSIDKTPDRQREIRERRESEG